VVVPEQASVVTPCETETLTEVGTNAESEAAQVLSSTAQVPVPAGPGRTCARAPAEPYSQKAPASKHDRRIEAAFINPSFLNVWEMFRKRDYTQLELTESN